MATRHPSRWGVLVTACALGLTAVACTGQPAPHTAPSPAPDYFGTTSFIGRTVTVHGTVTRVISEASFELDTRDYGDDSLLVLCAPSRDVTVGDRVRVSGNVQLFVHSAYAGAYPLAEDRRAYAEFAGERFLVTTDAMAAA